MGWRGEIRSRISELEQQRLRLEEQRRRVRGLGGPEGERLEAEAFHHNFDANRQSAARTTEHSSSTHSNEYSSERVRVRSSLWAEVRESLVRVHKGLCKLRLARRAHDR